MARGRNAVFVGRDVRVGPARRLLQVRRQREERDILVFARVHRHHDGGVPPNVLLDQVQVPQDNAQHQVHDDRNPDRFAPARALQIILQLDEQVRHMRIEITVSSFPVLRVVEAELLRLRLFGRGHRILEWNLCDRHALGELKLNKA